MLKPRERWLNDKLHLSHKKLNRAISKVITPKKLTNKQRKFLKLLILHYIYYDYAPMVVSLGCVGFYKNLSIKRGVVMNSIALLDNYISVGIGSQKEGKYSTLHIKDELKEIITPLESLMGVIKNKEHVVFLQETKKVYLADVKLACVKTKKKRRRVEFKRDEHVIGMERRIGVVNELIQSAEIVIEGKLMLPYQLRLRRIFSVGTYSFDSNTQLCASNSLGGRFYGGYWINIKPCKRKDITINGNTVQQLDYRAMHTQLLYLMRDKQPCIIYPYDIPALPNDECNSRKEVVKLAINSMLCVRGLDGAYTAFDNRMNGKENDDSKEELSKEAIHYLSSNHIDSKYLIDTILEYHSILKDIFPKDNDNIMGLKLQYLDSKIMDSILWEAAGKGVIILPVHDGLICEPNNKDYVMELMLQKILLHTKVEYNSSFMDRLIKLES